MNHFILNFNLTFSMGSVSGQANINSSTGASPVHVGNCKKDAFTKKRIISW
jgi:hypothetical protein